MRTSGIRYRTNFGVHQRSSHRIATDIIFTRSVDRNSRPTFILKSEIAASEADYTDETVKNFPTVKGLIYTMRDLKGGLERCASQKLNENMKNVDSFRFVVNNYDLLLNRCSLKLLNLNNSFANILGEALNKKCTYVDLCCAPGGFTYVILKLFTKYDLTVHLTSMSSSVDSFLPINQEALQSACGSNACIATLLEGDINEERFRRKFINRVNDRVDFVLADGGINFKNIENYQEYHSKMLLLNQIVTGLALLKDGGFMICKFFDMFLKYTTSLLYVTSTLFASFTICKPASSKAGNAERYVLFKGYKYDEKVLKFLNMASCMQNALKREGNVQMINSLTPSLDDPDNEDVAGFLKFVEVANKNVANNQNTALQKYLGMIKLSNVKDSRNVAFQSYRYWLNVIAPKKS